MKSFALIATLVGLALATPIEKRQDLPIAQYNDIPVLADVGAPVGDAVPVETASYNPVSVASAAAAVASNTDAADNVIVKRAGAPCTTRSYNGPQVTAPTDDPVAFQSYAPFAASATAAAQAAAVPSGYAVVPGAVNLKASIQDSHYLTYTTKDLSDYKPDICAAKCNAMAGCAAFNIYYERVPLSVSTLTQVPDSQTCPGLVSSPSATLLKCAFYGVAVKASQATNVGQFQGKFKVVIAGSNTYIRSSAPSLSGYDGPVSFGGAAINAPAPVIDHGYLRVQTFGQNVPFDPSLCAASCAAQTTFNAENDIGLGPCVFFNIYVLQKNGADGVLTCVYFSTPYGASYATETGQYDQAGNFFGVTQSYGYYVGGHYVD